MTTFKVRSPAKFAHFVLQTAQPEKMRDFYLTFLGGHISYENDEMSFLTYDEEHHRLALIRNDNLKPKDHATAGLLHVAFTFNTLDDLCGAYKERKAAGILPRWCCNHGPTISIYYVDPDGNQIETQVDSCSVDEANAFMDSPAYAKNPIGVDLDPEELCRRVESGESRESILARPDVGPRGADDIIEIQKRFLDPAPVAVGA